MKRSRLICISLMLTIASAMLAAQSSPVALIYQPLSPAAVQPGQPGFQLTVRGTGFVSGAVVKWNGKALQTKFVSSSKLEAAVPAAAIAQASTASVTVVNPGVIASNVIYFSVREPSSTVTLVTGPQSVEGGQVLVGDFNNDQWPDILVKATDGDADIYLNQENGNLVQVVGPVWGGTEFALPTAADLTADFNGDGNLDASLCTNDGSVYNGCTIFLGDGKGGLTALNYSGVGGIGSVADVNRDGILDYVTSYCDYSSCGLQVYFGNGDGTFTLSSIVIAEAKYSGVPVFGDFNNDGNLDLAVPRPDGKIGILLGNGQGGFHKEVVYPTQYPADQIAVADVNGDGILDVVTNGVSVLLGKGDGTFRAGPSISVPSAYTIHLADVNGDGKLDLVTVTIDSNYNQTLQILLGDGMGSFASPITFAEGQSYWYPEIGVADLNNDGELDFILGGGSSSTVLLQK